jgi:hypothetical protein
MEAKTTRGACPAERAHHAGEAGPAGSDWRGRRRMSAKREQSAVLRLLRGEDLELVSRDLGFTAAELSGWRAAFLAAGEASLKSRPARRRRGRRRARRRRAPAGALVLAPLHAARTRVPAQRRARARLARRAPARDSLRLSLPDAQRAGRRRAAEPAQGGARLRHRARGRPPAGPEAARRCGSLRFISLRLQHQIWPLWSCLNGPDRPSG